MPEVLLPCTRFAVRIRSGAFGEPTNLEKTILYYLRFLESRERVGGASLEDLEDALGVGTAILTDMLVDFINLRWVNLAPDGTVTISDTASEILDNPGRHRELGTTDQGNRLVFCFDLVGGDFALIDRRHLIKNATGNNVLPPTVEGTAAADSDLGYPYPLDGYTLKNMGKRSFEDRIFRAIESSAWARTLLKGMNPRSSSVEPLPLRRPLSFAEDLFQYRTSFDVVISNSGPDQIALTPSRDIAGPNERRLARLNAEPVAEIAREASELGSGNFHSYLASSKRRTGANFMPSKGELRRLIDITDGEFEPSDWDAAQECWTEAKQTLRDTLSNEIDFASSKAVPSGNGWQEIASLTASARQRLLIVSPFASVASPALSPLTGSLLENAAGVIQRNPDASLIVNVVEHERATAATDMIATRLGFDRLVSSTRQMRHMSTSLIACDEDTFLWSVEACLGDREPTGLLLKGRGQAEGDDEQVDGGVATIRSLVENLPRELERKLSRDNEVESYPVESSPPRKRATRVDAIINEVDAKLDSSVALSEHEGALPELRIQLAWLNEWAEEHSESFEILVGAEIFIEAGRIMTESAAHDPLIIATSDKRDADDISVLPKMIRPRLISTSDDDTATTAGQTIVALPAGAGGGHSPFTHVRDELQSDFSSSKAPAKLLDLTKHGPSLGFVAGPSSIVLARDSLFGFVPPSMRANKGLPIGVLLRGRRAKQLGLDLALDRYPELAGQLPKVHVKKPGAPPVSGEAVSRIHSSWQSERWFEDGNRGATRFLAAFQESGGVPWSVLLHDPLYARSRFLAPSENGEQNIDNQSVEMAYAVLKAAALRGDEAHASTREDALTELAKVWETEQRYLPAAIMAERLPEGHWLQEPLARKLAACISRGLAPMLEEAEGNALTNPSPASLILSALLMLDGLEGNLPSWLIYLEPTSTDGQEQRLLKFVRALAEFRRERPGSALDLSHLRGEVPAQQLESVALDLCSQIEAQIDKPKKGGAKSVGALRAELFEADGSLFAEFRMFVRDFQSRKTTGAKKGWSEASEGQRVMRLRSLLSDVETKDIGRNLLESLNVERETISPDRIADEHWQRKQQAMISRTGFDPVMIHRGGRGTLNATRAIFRDIFSRLIPLLQKNVAATEVALNDEGRKLLEGSQPSQIDKIESLWRVLRDRLTNREATRPLQEPPWTFPLVTDADLEIPDWKNLGQKVMNREFPSKVGLADVVTWHLNQAGRFLSDDEGATEGSHELLVELHEMLEGLRGTIEPVDAESLEQIVKVRFSTLKTSILDRARAYAAFLDQTPLDKSGFQAAHNKIGTAAEEISIAVETHDLETATLAAVEILEVFSDLRTEFERLFGVFETRWKNLQQDAKILDQGLSILRDDRNRKSRLEILPRLISDYDQFGSRFRQVKIAQNAKFARDFVQQRKGSDDAEVSGGAHGLLALITELTEKSSTDDPSRLTEAQVIESIFGFFTSENPDHFLPTAIFKDEFWILETFGQPLDHLTLEPAGGHLRMWLPATPDAESKIRSGKIMGTAPENGSALLLAIHHAGAVNTMTAFTKSDLALAGTMAPDDRKLRLVSLQLSSIRRGDGGFRGWWKRAEADPPSMARFIRSIILSDDELTAPDGRSDDLRVGYLPEFLARFSIAFELGDKINFEKTERCLSEQKIAELSTIYSDYMATRQEKNSETNISDGELISLLSAASGFS